MKMASFAFALRRYDADCRGKQAFEDPTVAREVAARMRRRRRRAASVYRCAHCGRWHIGGGRGER